MSRSLTIDEPAGRDYSRLHEINLEKGLVARHQHVDGSSDGSVKDRLIIGVRDRNCRITGLDKFEVDAFKKCLKGWQKVRPFPPDDLVQFIEYQTAKRR